MKRAQASMEYMTIVGFVFILLIPLLFIYYDYRSDTRDAISGNHAYKVAKSVADNAETIFYLGKPSRTILKLNFPPQITNISIKDYEIVLTMSTTNGEDHIVVPTTVNVSGTLGIQEGIHHVAIESKGSYVYISE